VNTRAANHRLGLIALPAFAADVSAAAGRGLITGLIAALAATGVAAILAAALFWRERRRADRELTALPGGAMVWRGQRDAAQTTITPRTDPPVGSQARQYRRL